MMHNEIGSEFWDIPTCRSENNIFSSATKWFLAGRTALKYIIQDADLSSVSMPQWCCESMIAPFVEAGVEVHFYADIADSTCDAIFLIDYFGYRGKSCRPPQYKGIVIRDVTHSIFSRTYNDADYYFGSLRKWAGFWTGGFAWGNWKKNYSIPQYNDEYVFLRKQAMEMKRQYIEGKSNEKDYFSIYEEANRRLAKIGICGAHPRDIEAAAYLDTASMKAKRRKNAAVLLQYNRGIFEFGEDDCPLFVPVLVDNRDALRKHLIEKKNLLPGSLASLGFRWKRTELDLRSEI